MLIFIVTKHSLYWNWTGPSIMIPKGKNMIKEERNIWKGKE